MTDAVPPHGECHASVCAGCTYRCVTYSPARFRGCWWRDIERKASLQKEHVPYRDEQSAPRDRAG